MQLRLRHWSKQIEVELLKAARLVFVDLYVVPVLFITVPAATDPFVASLIVVKMSETGEKRCKQCYRHNYSKNGDAFGEQDY